MSSEKRRRKKTVKALDAKEVRGIICDICGTIPIIYTNQDGNKELMCLHCGQKIMMIRCS